MKRIVVMQEMVKQFMFQLLVLTLGFLLLNGFVIVSGITSLPTPLVNISNLDTFKSKLKQYLITY